MLDAVENQLTPEEMRAAIKRMDEEY